MSTELHDRLQTALGESYEIERELAPGGMSRLFLATERSLDRRVVVKLLPPELASEAGAQRFQREILVTARLQHPHILPVLSAGARDGLLYYITPYVGDESLRHRIAVRGALPIEETVRLLRTVADALAFAHALGVVHRDLKPDNIFLQHGHAILADFGIARAVEQATLATPAQRLTGTGMGLGTPGYMAPEQLAGEPNVDARADIYAMGVVAYEMLAGHPPFAGRSAPKLMIAHMTETPEPVTARRGDAPPRLARAVMRCLEKDPSDRWQTVDDLVPVLDELIAPPATRPTHPSAIPAPLGEAAARDDALLRRGLEAVERCRAPARSRAPRAPRRGRVVGRQERRMHPRARTGVCALSRAR